MKKTRRIGAILAMATAAAGMASAATTAPASAAIRGPQPVSNWLRAVNANTDSLVDIYWRSDRRICDVEVRVSGRSVQVGYPGHRRFATFNRDDTLRPGRADRTTVQVNPAFSRAGVANLWATISYDNCLRDAPTQRQNSSLSLPVLSNSDRPGHGGPGIGGPGHGGPGNGGPGHGGPGHGGPGSGVLGSGVPGSGVPGSGVPGSGVPGSGVPGSGVPGSGGPGHGGPSSGGPGHGGPGSGGPSSSGPGSSGQGPQADPSPSGSPSGPGSHGQGGPGGQGHHSGPNS